MSNPFEFFANDDDEESYQKTPANESKVKRTHQQKRLFKQQKGTTQGSEISAPVITEQLHQRRKENAKQIRNTRAPPTPTTKKLGQGHFLDRRSGTGRVDKLRKEGGGYNNVGNVKDQLNQRKYIKQIPEQPQTAEAHPAQVQQTEVPPKPEPSKLTLEEYYKSKGIEVSNNISQKVPVKKADINADWIKKEKLIVLQTKEDKKNKERKAQGLVKYSDSRSGLDENLQALGFGQKATKKVEQKKEGKQQSYRGGKGKKDNPVIQDQDFPTL